MNAPSQAQSHSASERSAAASVHTPGPWKFVRHGNTGFIWSDAVNRPVGADISGINFTDGSDTGEVEREANAALIAAAPETAAQRDELLAACKRALPWLGKLIANGGHMASVLPRDAEIAMDMTQAAIARAEASERRAL